MVHRDAGTLLQSSLTDVVLVGDEMYWGHRSSLAICKISPLCFLHGSRLPHVSQVRITDEMLYLNITFYTNRTQDNYLQKTHFISFHIFMEGGPSVITDLQGALRLHYIYIARKRKIITNMKTNCNV